MPVPIEPRLGLKLEKPFRKIREAFSAVRATLFTSGEHMEKTQFRLSRVGTILLGVSQAARSIAFYRDTLGLPLTAQFEGFAFFNAGGVTLALSEGLARAIPQIAGATEVVFAVEGVREAYEALRGKGVAFTIEPRQVAGPNWAANFADPDGHHLSVFGPEKATC
jgi:catechol 2,3-dioxygenase-like lactoylglutathione lyase family enzyme